MRLESCVLEVIWGPVIVISEIFFYFRIRKHVRRIKNNKIVCVVSMMKKKKKKKKKKKGKEQKKNNNVGDSKRERKGMRQRKK